MKLAVDCPVFGLHQSFIFYTSLSAPPPPPPPPPPPFILFNLKLMIVSGLQIQITNLSQVTAKFSPSPSDCCVEDCSHLSIPEFSPCEKQTGHAGHTHARNSAFPISTSQIHSNACLPGPLQTYNDMLDRQSDTYLITFLSPDMTLRDEWALGTK